MSNLIDILPSDVWDYIMNIVKTRSVLYIQQVIRNNIVYRIRKAIYTLSSDSFHSIIKYSYSVFTVDYYNITVNRGYTKQELINLFNMCKCCSRHSKNKPDRVMSWTHINCHNAIGGNSIPECECQCRHLSRVLSWNGIVRYNGLFRYN